MAMMVTLWFLRGSRPVFLRDPKFLWFFKACLENLSHPSGSAHAFHSLLSSGTFCQLLITFPISLDPHQIVGPDMNSNSFNFWWLLIKVFWKQSFMIKKSQQTAIKHAKLPSSLLSFQKKKNSGISSYLQTAWSRSGRQQKVADNLCRLYGRRSGLTECPLQILFSKSTFSESSFKTVTYISHCSRIPSECRILWIHIRPDILSGLIWVQTVCLSFQQTALEDQDKISWTG